MARIRNSFRPAIECLESRLVPYALSGYQWANVNVSASFMPDGTLTDAGLASDLFAKLNAVAPTATWQREFARALQTWASVTPLNFHFVADNGAVAGSAGLAQGDSRFGDVRLGGYVRTDPYIGYAYFPAGGTLGGDEFLHTGVNWHIGEWLDLYSTFLHETGHALGLEHSSVITAVMYPSVSDVYSGLAADDIAGIRAVYGVRSQDAYDAATVNDSFGSATSLSLDASGAVALNADLTSVADVDYFRVVAPAVFDGTLTVSMDASALSLLGGKIAVYDAAQNLLGSASAGSGYGGLVAVTLSGLSAGQNYFLAADGANADVFGMGAYRLSAQFGGVPVLPSLSIHDVTRTEGNSGASLATFTVALSSPSSNSVTLQYATADDSAVAGSDYTAASGTLTFAPGETQKTITVTINGDTVVEANERFWVNLSAAENATVSDGQASARTR